MNVPLKHRASTIQPIALVPTVKAHIDRFCVAHQVEVPRAEKEAAEQKTLNEVWKSILAPIDDATHPNTGVRWLLLK